MSETGNYPAMGNHDARMLDRRHRMTEVERLTEDMVDQYTEAVKKGEITRFFARYAILVTRLREKADAFDRLVRSATRATSILEDAARNARGAAIGFDELVRELEETIHDKETIGDGRQEEG